MIKRVLTWKLLTVNGLSHDAATRRTDHLMKIHNPMPVPTNDHGQPLPYMMNPSLDSADIKHDIEDWVRFPALDQHGNLWS